MGKKRKSPHEDQKQFEEFQAATRRQNFEFLDAKERRKRVCRWASQLDVYLDKAIALANKALEEGNQITAVIDTEGDQVNFDSDYRKRVRNADGKIVSGDAYYHHRRTLQRDGLSAEEIRIREINQRKITKNWQNKKPAQKVRDFYTVQAQKVNSGLLQSDCHVIQVAIVEDVEDDCTFILQATQLVANEYRGEAKLPPKFEEFLTHPAVYITNVSVYDDIANIVNSFYGGRLHGVKYTELENHG